MNWIDLLLIIVILLAAWSGFKRGFILGSLELLSWLGSMTAAFWLYQYLARFLQMIIPALGMWTMPLAFLITLIIARIIFSITVTAILRHAHSDSHQTKANKLLGLVPGAVNGVLYAIILSALLLVLPLSDGLSASVRESNVATEFGNQVAWLDEKLSPRF